MTSTLEIFRNTMKTNYTEYIKKNLTDKYDITLKVYDEIEYFRNYDSS